MSDSLISIFHILYSYFLITWCQSLTYNCLPATNCVPKISFEKRSKITMSLIIQIFELWWTFFFCCGLFQEYKRKLARVTQVRKELRSRLNNLPGGLYNSSNWLTFHLRHLTLPLLKHLNTSSVLDFWKVSVSPCVVTCGSHSVFNRLFIHTAFINRNVFFFCVCELISLCCMLSVHCKLRLKIIRHRPFMFWPLPI